MPADTGTAAANAHAGWIWQRVRAAPAHVAAELRSRGLRPVGPDPARAECFKRAGQYLELVPSLEVELMRLVQQVTLLEASLGYDVSHSEPRWTTTIFVSAAPATERHAALRLLENVVHEGMHLRLTEIESATPLVRQGAARIFSPWKSEDREAQGVLQGLYVFTCISALFVHPQLIAGLDADGRAYASRRVSEIGIEVESVDLVSLRHGLNHAGRLFLHALVQANPSEAPWTLACL